MGKKNPEPEGAGPSGSEGENQNVECPNVEEMTNARMTKPHEPACRRQELLIRALYFAPSFVIR